MARSFITFLIIFLGMCVVFSQSEALERSDVEFKIF